MLEPHFHIGQIFFGTDANECMVLGRQLLKYSLVMNGKILGKVLDSNFFKPQFGRQIPIVLSTPANPNGYDLKPVGAHQGDR